jgi:hypothetical protein
MELSEAVITFITNVSGTIVAIITIAGIVAKIKPIGRWMKQAVFRELYAADKRHDERLDSLELKQLKQVICDRRIPPGDRLNAGEEYLQRGANGEVRAVYESLKQYVEKKQMASLESWDREQRERREEAV